MRVENGIMLINERGCMEATRIFRCDISTDCASYDELKRRHVVAQGWSPTGDVSFLMDENDIEKYAKVAQYLCERAYECDIKFDQLKNVLAVLTKARPGDVFIATEGESIKGICELPQDFLYVYSDEGCLEYANSIYPVRWVDWKEFCDGTSTINRSPGPMKRIKNEVASYVMENWESYKKRKGIELQPSECKEELERKLSEKTKKIIESKERYSMLLKDMEQEMRVEEIETILEGSGNLILTGAPGTGKTYLAREIAMKVAKSEDRVTNVQFHPSYGYADFVEGLRPVKKGDVLGFERRDGAFMKLCRRAVGDVDHNYVVVIDEINRGDISKIFGELFSLIEKDYRTFDGKVDGKKVAVETQYGNLWMDGFEDGMDESAKELFKDGFFVPQNVYIIGTMNDVDRSVESMDFAIRRRFVWYEVEPNDRLDAMCTGKGIDEKKRGDIRLHMAALNDRIKKDPALGPAYQIGPSYFIRLGDGGYEELWIKHLSHLFKEYLRGNPEQEKIVDGYHQLLLNPVAKDDNDAQGSDN